MCLRENGGCGGEWMSDGSAAVPRQIARVSRRVPRCAPPLQPRRGFARRVTYWGPPSLLPRCPNPPPRRGGGAVVAAGAEFDAAVDEAEVEPLDEAAVAALLAEIAQARARPFAKAMTREPTHSAMTCATPLTHAVGAARSRGETFQPRLRLATLGAGPLRRQ